MTYLLALLPLITVSTALRVGVGIYDMTGPPAEVIFMGYANFEQKGVGIHLRQFARAFVLEQDGERVVFVSVDAGMTGIGVRREVLKHLGKRYGQLYNENNTIISGTHTHSTPGGFLMDFLFDLPILGFVRETFTSHVVGIIKSIIIAHNNLTPAEVEYGEGEILDANINRSPRAYLRNPESERARYQYDVDKTLQQIRFKRENDGSLLGVINWFPIHPTSMNNTNKLISSDNVGYASILMEKELNGNRSHPGTGKIVCAFASTNLGDVSPNTKGPRCEFSRAVCDNEILLCKKDEKCFASGPGKDMFDSTRIIATKLFNAAMNVLRSSGEKISGPLGMAHQYVDMPKEKAYQYDPTTQTFNASTVGGCSPAMGYSFAAGTTDGPGAFNFTQGTTSSNALWNAVRDFVAEPTPHDIDCHKPKPILFATGRAKFPYEWQPSVVSCSVVRIGSLVIAAVPGEFTTMAGRRLKDVVKGTAASHVVIAGLSNVYADYVATPEEYMQQRYEGASTIYGPYTLDIYLNKYLELRKAAFNGDKMPAKSVPTDLSASLISLVPPVLWDAAPWGRDFGDCLHQPLRDYRYGDTVEATFVSGHPRNDIRHGRSYIAIERLLDETNDDWEVIAVDGDWETKFIWERSSTILGTSTATALWDIPYGITPGVYRIHHYGSYKYILGGIYPYSGFTDTFTVEEKNH